MSRVDHVCTNCGTQRTMRLNRVCLTCHQAGATPTTFVARRIPTERELRLRSGKPEPRTVQSVLHGALPQAHRFDAQLPGRHCAWHLGPRESPI